MAVNWLLIRVDDLGRAVARKGLLDNLLGLDSRRRDPDLVRRHLAAANIHEGRAVPEASCHRDTAGVQGLAGCLNTSKRSPPPR